MIVFSVTDENKMAWKNLKQRSLADSLLIEHADLEELDGVNNLIDWASTESMLSHIYNKLHGEKARPPLMMFKVLFL